MNLQEVIDLFSKNVVEKTFSINHGLERYDTSLSLSYGQRAYRVDITENKISKFFVSPITTPLESLNLVGEVIFDHLNNKVLIRKKIPNEYLDKNQLLVKDQAGNYIMLERGNIQRKIYNKPIQYVTNNN